MNFAGCYGLREWFSHYGVTPETPFGYGHVGVALATSLVALVNFTALAYLLRRKISRLNGRSILSAFVKIAISSAVLSVVCYASYHFILARYGSKGITLHLIEAFVPIALGGAAFVVCAMLLRVHELHQLYAMISKRFRRSAV